jgi:hypothetical protein
MSNYSKTGLLWALTPGDIHDFNGCAVRLIRVLAVHEGQTWRVETLDGRRKGEKFNIPCNMLDRLDLLNHEERSRFLNFGIPPEVKK